MTLYLIGLGLATNKDISLRGLEIVKSCDVVYAEQYTSLLQCSLSDLEKQYGRKITPTNREFTEQQSEKIIAQAKHKNVAFLVVGDPFSATTHIELFRLAREKKIQVQVIHNASILTAVGITGLQLYKFGAVSSLPFPQDVPHLEAPYLILQENYYLNRHTLFLLDLKPEQNKFLTISEAIGILETIEKRKKENVVKQDMLVVGCARLGAENFVVKSGPLKQIRTMDFGPPPFCLIIPARNLHFVEKEMLEWWS